MKWLILALLTSQASAQSLTVEERFTSVERHGYDQRGNFGSLVDSQPGLRRALADLGQTADPRIKIRAESFELAFEPFFLAASYQTVDVDPGLGGDGSLDRQLQALGYRPATRLHRAGFGDTVVGARDSMELWRGFGLDVEGRLSIPTGSTRRRRCGSARCWARMGSCSAPSRFSPAPCRL